MRLDRRPTTTPKSQLGCRLRTLGRPIIPSFVAFCFTPETVKIPSSAMTSSSTDSSMLRRVLNRSMTSTIAIVASLRFPRSLHARIPATVALPFFFVQKCLCLIASYYEPLYAIRLPPPDFPDSLDYAPLNVLPPLLNTKL